MGLYLVRHSVARSQDIMSYNSNQSSRRIPSNRIEHSRCSAAGFATQGNKSIAIMAASTKTVRSRIYEVPHAAEGMCLKNNELSDLGSWRQQGIFSWNWWNWSLAKRKWLGQICRCNLSGLNLIQMQFMLDRCSPNSPGLLIHTEHWNLGFV